MKTTRVKALKAFVHDDHTQIEVVGTFMDDHVLGCVVDLGGVEIAFPWTGWELVAAFKYAAGGCPDALAHAKAHVKDMLKESRVSDLEEMTDPKGWVPE